MRSYICLSILGMLPACLGAQTPPAAPLPVMTMAQAVQYAHDHNPGLLAGSRHVAAVKANEITAGLRLNPNLAETATQLGLTGGDPNGPTLTGVGLQRVFETGGKRQLRLNAATANSKVALDQLSDQQRGLDLAVRTAFTRMLLAKLALAIANDNLSGYQHTVALMKVRLDAGDVDRTDYERVELQLAGFEADQTNARLTLTQASEQLQLTLGLPRAAADFDVAGALDTPPLTESLADLERTALAERPDLAAAQRQVEANDAGVRLADAMGKTDPQLGAEYERSGTANTFGVNLVVPLRVFDRNQGEKARTRYEADSSRLLVTQVRNQILSDVDQAYAAYQAALEQTARYRDKYLGEAAHVRDNLEFAYRNGDATLLDYLSALSDYRLVNLAALNAQAQAQLALHQLSYATATEVHP